MINFFAICFWTWCIGFYFLLCWLIIACLLVIVVLWAFLEFPTLYTILTFFLRIFPSHEIVFMLPVLSIYSTFVGSARSEAEEAAIRLFSAAGLKFLIKATTASVNFSSSPNKKWCRIGMTYIGNVSNSTLNFINLMASFSVVRIIFFEASILSNLFFMSFRSSILKIK